SPASRRQPSGRTRPSPPTPGAPSCCGCWGIPTRRATLPLPTPRVSP
ncbi:hypothetical protein AKKGGB_AKKGGB_11515, partial [Dysosmobacter welbionis]